MSSFSFSERPSNESGGTRSSWTSTMMRSLRRGSKVIRLCDDNLNGARSLLAQSTLSLHDGAFRERGLRRVISILYNDRSCFPARDRSCTDARRCLQQRSVAPPDAPSAENLQHSVSICVADRQKRSGADRDRKQRAIRSRNVRVCDDSVRAK